MTVVCAWCRQVLATGSETVSHGICGPCSVRLEASFMRKLRTGTRRKMATAPRQRPRASAPLPGFESMLQAGPLWAPGLCP